MTMYRKDYELMAAALKAGRKSVTQGGVNDGLVLLGFDTAVRHLADALEWDSPRFDKDKFLMASGV